MIILFSLSYNIFFKKILRRSDDPIPRAEVARSENIFSTLCCQKTPGTMAQRSVYHPSQSS